MTKDKLRKRLKRKEATPLQAKVEPLNNNRRGTNYVDMNIEENLSHDDFFEFEKDLVDIQSSRNLAANAPNATSFFTTDSFTIESEASSVTVKSDKVNEPSYIVMEEAPVEISKPSFGMILEEIDEEEEEEVIEESSLKFEFVQCRALKSNGERCKRQAPKGFETCSIASHRKQEPSTNKSEID